MKRRALSLAAAAAAAATIFMLTSCSREPQSAASSTSTPASLQSPATSTPIETSAPPPTPTVAPTETAQPTPLVIRIVTAPGHTAPLCPEIECTQAQMDRGPRIPGGTRFEVIRVQTQTNRGARFRWDVRYFLVEYKGRQGWVSEYFTDQAPDKPKELPL